jgi:hypothetical protein
MWSIPTVVMSTANVEPTTTLVLGSADVEYSGLSSRLSPEDTGLVDRQAMQASTRLWQGCQPASLTGRQRRPGPE